MVAPVIQVERIGKRYRLGEREPYVALRDVIANSLKAPLRWLDKAGQNGHRAENHIWSLRDVTCQVKDGESLGIVGRNGAGKSTLLKILARVTKPTEGRAVVRGRIGSLLEVGTGFHPELTGRENVYLNGAILGMTRREIESKFDEIVAFSGVEKFIDTPLKHYSSGMQMRLAFSVAAHLEPEILLVDEVLAVGDLEFQKKCLGKMEEVTRHGRTVLFVSHNMGAIRRLCTRGIWLDGGRLRYEGTAGECIDAYTASVENSEVGSGLIDLTARADRHGDNRLRISRIWFRGLDGAAKNNFEFGEPFSIEFEVACREAVRSSFVGFTILASDGTSVIGSHDTDSGRVQEMRAGQEYTARCTLSPNLLKPGSYTLQPCVADITSWEPHDWLYAAGQFTISEGSGRFGRVPDHRPALVQPLLKWQWNAPAEVPAGFSGEKIA